MKRLTLSKAKARLGGVARDVIRSKQPVIVKVAQGFIPIAPYEFPKEVTAFGSGNLTLSARERQWHNTFGETLSTNGAGTSFSFPPIPRTSDCCLA